MKRDMDYVREILLRVEAAGPEFDGDGILSEGYSSEDAAKLDDHLKMMIDDAGLLRGDEHQVIGGGSGSDWINLRMTWAGHEYLDAVRDPQIWENTKAGAAKAGAFSFDVLKALARGLVKEKVKQITGVGLEF